MTNTTINKIILSAATAMFLTACGSSDSTPPSAAEIASAKIQAYAEDGTKPKPTVADYTAAGVTGVTEENLAAYNILVDAKTGADVDTVAELKALVAEIPTPDTTAPVVTPAAATVTVAFGGTYTDGGATVTDNVDTGLSATASGTVDTNTAGDYTITYTATDAAGNTGTATTVVTVSPEVVADTTAPVVRPAAAAVTVPFGGTYTDGGATVTDNVDTNLTATASGTVDTNTAGKYTITYTATDAAGNEGTATTVVTVSPAGYVKNANGTVTDEKTGLTWNNAVSTCTATQRIPTLAEFQTILDYSLVGAPILADINVTTESDYNTADNWQVNQHGAIVTSQDYTNTICITEGSYTPSAATFTRDAATDTVTDGTLVWADTGSTSKEYNATDCADGFRLPTVVELETIFNRATGNVEDKFENLDDASYWTSTPSANYNVINWTINPLTGEYGGAYREDFNATTPADEKFVLCVKDAE